MAYMLPRKRFFYVTSGAQLSETNSTFSFEIQLPDSEAYDRIVMTQCLIPLSYYVIQNGANTFTLTEGTDSIVITIPPGNYNVSNFPVIVGALLDTASPNGLDYTITYPDPLTQVDTGKFTYVVNSSSIPIYFTFPMGSHIATQFGFDRGETDYFTSGSGTSTLVSQNVVDFVAENSIFIHSNLVEDAYTDVLQEIFSVNTAPLQNITYLCPDPMAYSKRLSSSKCRAATFSLTDEFNSPIFLNGLDVVLTIMIYKEPDFYKKADNYIKYAMTKDMTKLPEE